MKTLGKNIGLAAAVALIPTFLLWLPFFFRIPSFWNIPIPRNGLATVVSNYDGPLYIVVAKSLYNVDVIKTFPFSLPVEYYAAHFPAYPILIRLVSLVTNFPYAMLIVTLLSSVLLFYYFFKYISEFIDDKFSVFLIALIFSFFPARFLVVRSVGSPEPLFVGAVLASVFYFRKKKYLLAGAFGALAQMTKSPGILLFISYVFALLVPAISDVSNNSVRNIFKKILVPLAKISLIPLSLVVVFAIYQLTYGDFFAYFKSGDNIHLFFPPFQIFNYSAPWVNTHWLEEIVFVYLLFAFGIVRLYQKKYFVEFWFALVFFTSIIFVSHRDIVRYSLPIVPFMYTAYIDVFKTRSNMLVFLFLAIPVYLFALAFVSQNAMPIANWSALL